MAVVCDANLSSYESIALLVTEL